MHPVDLRFRNQGGAFIFMRCRKLSFTRLLGKGETEKADECVSTALAIGTAVGIATVSVMLIELDPLLRFLGCTDTMMPYAHEYAIPFIIGLAINVSMQR